MFRRLASLLVCAAVGVAMLGMRPTAALAGGLDIDFTLTGTREIVSSNMTYDELVASLPETYLATAGYGQLLLPVTVGMQKGIYTEGGTNYTDVQYYNSTTYSMDGGDLYFDYCFPWNISGPNAGSSSSGIPTGSGRMLYRLIATSSTNFPAGKYYIARSNRVVRMLCGDEETHSTRMYKDTSASTEYGSGGFWIRPSWTQMISASIARSTVAYWDGDEARWVVPEQDEDGFSILPKPCKFIACVLLSNSASWTLDPTNDGHFTHANYATDCVPTFSIGGMWEAQQIINVLNGDDGSTVTGTINSQTDTLMDTSGSDSIVSGATAGGVSSLMGRLGFIGQIPQVVSSFLAPIGSASASDGLFFPGVTVLGYELIPAQMVPVWQNGLAALETPIKAFNTGVLAVLFVKGAKHVLHKDLLGWDDEEGDSE